MKRRPRHSIALLLLAVSSMLLVGARGGSGIADAAVTPPARRIKVEGRSYAYSPKKINVTAGENIVIVFHSRDQLHDVTLQGGKVVVEAKGGKTATGKLRLKKPGTYKFFCSIPGHRTAGMEGTITAS